LLFKILIIMKTLYDILNEEPLGQFRKQAYTVNGKPGTLPDNIVELDVVYGELPQGKKEISREWIADLGAKEYRQIIHWREYTDQEIALQEWVHTEFAMRIVAPIQLALQYPQFEVWFRLNDLPIIKKGQQILCYCNEILPEHQPLVDGIESITIEYMP
jgi:hypothetical protein